MQNELAIGSPTAHLPREHWDTWDPMLISEGTVYIFGQYSCDKITMTQIQISRQIETAFSEILAIK